MKCVKNSSSCWQKKTFLKLFLSGVKVENSQTCLQKFLKNIEHQFAIGHALNDTKNDLTTAYKNPCFVILTLELTLKNVIMVP